MRKLLLATTALIALTTAANAFTIDIIAAIDRGAAFFDPPGVTAQTFAGSGANQQINNAGANLQNAYTSVNGGTALSGLFIGNVPVNVVNEEASPFGNFNDSRVYLAAGGGGGLLTLSSLTGIHNSLSMLWGTVDSGDFRNRIVTNGIDVITGNMVLAACAAQGFTCNDGQTNVWLSIDGMKDFTIAKFSDADANSFEFAPAVQAVPEPATWAMMLAGFIGVGVMALRRRRDGRLFRLA